MDPDRAQLFYEFQGHSTCAVNYATGEFDAQCFASNNMHSTTHVVHIANASGVCVRPQTP
jgi:hypothetical protein